MRFSRLFRVRSLRKSHRYLGLFVGIQLLLWTVSGLYFAWNPLQKVRGEHLAAEPATLADVIDAESYADLVSPADAVAALGDDAAEVDALALRPLLGAPVYEIRHRTGDERATALVTALVDARTGVLRGGVSEDEARRIADADFTGEAEILRVERVESSSPDGEYRGGPFPAWRVTFDHPTGTRLYVAADTGHITARRNDTWRVFDFLWMFHILDFEERNDFNHWLLRILSVLGVVTVLSGFVLFVATSSWAIERRARAARASSSG